ncbi:MAG: glycosyltransferase, partial [bacterium]
MTESTLGRKIRLAVLVSTLPTGGAERVTFNLLTRLDPGRFDSEVYFLKEPGTIGMSLLEHGIRGYPRLQKLRYDPFLIFRLLRRVRAFSPDVFLILNCHRNAMFWGGLCSLLTDTGKRVIAVHHTGTNNSPKNFDGVDRLFLGSTASIVALSNLHARYIEEVDGLDPAKITIIENGIIIDKYGRSDAQKLSELRAALEITENEKVVIMVAGLRPEKAHEALIRAAHILQERRTDVRFLIVGDGPRRQELEEMARASHVRESVMFLGERDDVADLLHLAHVFVLPSHSVVETLPLSVMEAMAAGVPVVASAVGSVPDMIEDRVNGILIPPADGERLAEALGDLLSDDAFARL